MAFLEDEEQCPVLFDAKNWLKSSAEPSRITEKHDGFSKNSAKKKFSQQSLL